ncbi:hypothetical protein [Candidatus Villigracilis saccharophilus]|uniref:hypothetical protein n=1 Tax=Candidatus Villigracilis saccharophilus TaxID=3140684 RepID=UPI0031360623|nr:hypothetical protein [Anaerolineales bacterium]
MNNTGKAYFGDFQILAQKGSESPQVLVDITIDLESIIWKNPDPDPSYLGYRRKIITTLPKAAPDR